jgi:hypothetical protein
MVSGFLWTDIIIPLGLAVELGPVVKKMSTRRRHTVTQQSVYESKPKQATGIPVIRENANNRPSARPVRVGHNNTVCNKVFFLGEIISILSYLLLS